MKILPLSWRYVRPKAACIPTHGEGGGVDRSHGNRGPLAKVTLQRLWQINRFFFSIESIPLGSFHRFLALSASVAVVCKDWWLKLAAGNSHAGDSHWSKTEDTRYTLHKGKYRLNEYMMAGTSDYCTLRTWIWRNKCKEKVLTYANAQSQIINHIIRIYMNISQSTICSILVEELFGSYRGLGLPSFPGHFPDYPDHPWSWRMRNWAWRSSKPMGFLGNDSLLWSQPV